MSNIFDQANLIAAQAELALDLEAYQKALQDDDFEAAFPLILRAAHDDVLLNAMERIKRDFLVGRAYAKEAVGPLLEQAMQKARETQRLRVVLVQTALIAIEARHQVSLSEVERTIEPLNMLDDIEQALINMINSIKKRYVFKPGGGYPIVWLARLVECRVEQDRKKRPELYPECSPMPKTFDESEPGDFE